MMMVRDDLRCVEDKLKWMRAERIWPNGLRYLWTDAFGVVLLASLHAESGKRHYLDVRFAFTNYGVSIGLQAANAMSDRIGRLHAYFEAYHSGDEYDREAITHVMACSAHFPGYLIRGFG